MSLCPRCECFPNECPIIKRVEKQAELVGSSLTETEWNIYTRRVLRFVYSSGCANDQIESQINEITLRKDQNGEFRKR